MTQQAQYNTMPSSMIDLPVELQLQIISYLPAEDIFQLQMINKHFHTLVDIHRPALKRLIKTQVHTFISTFQQKSFCLRSCCIQQRERFNEIFSDIANSLAEHIFHVQPSSSLLFHFAALDCLVAHEERIPFWLEWLFVDYIASHIGSMAAMYMKSKRCKMARKSVLYGDGPILPRMHVTRAEG